MDDIKFEDLGLSPEVMEAVKKAGYETPSPIQAKAIPPMLRGENILGTAQTGTGKTAAFTLPLLSRLDFSSKNTAMLVLSPTRELAIQVAEAVQQYACAMPRIHVVPVYGGQDIVVQFRALKRTAQIIIATPGRLIDHLELPLPSPLRPLWRTRQLHPVPVPLPRAKRHDQGRVRQPLRAAIRPFV